MNQPAHPLSDYDSTVGLAQTNQIEFLRQLSEHRVDVAGGNSCRLAVPSATAQTQSGS